MPLPGRPTSHILPSSTHRAIDRSDSISPSSVPIRKRVGLSNLDVNRIPVTVNSGHPPTDSKPTIHKRSLSDTDTCAALSASASPSSCSVDSQRLDRVSLPHSDLRLPFLPTLNVPDHLSPYHSPKQSFLQNPPIVVPTRNSLGLHPQLPSISLSPTDQCHQSSQSQVLNLESLTSTAAPRNGYSRSRHTVPYGDDPTFRVSSVSENQSRPSGPHQQPLIRQNLAPNADDAHHGGQIQLQLLPSSFKLQQQAQHSLENTLPAQPQRDNLPSAFPNGMSAGIWSHNVACVPRQDPIASENRIDQFSPLATSRTSSLDGETEECEASAQTAALMDQPEGEVLMYTCQFCLKTYQGRHARSIWRRHLSDKHKIPLATQPRRTRWDNDANRPQTDEERRERTLESKRRWARKNRAAKKAAREAQKPAEAAGIAAEINVDTFDATSRATSPSHDTSAPPMPILRSRPATSAASHNRLGVPNANCGRSQSLQATDAHSRDSLQTTTRLSSAPHQGSQRSVSMSIDQTPSHDTLAPMPLFPSSTSFQFSTPISTETYNIQSFQQNHFGAFGHQAVHQDRTLEQSHNTPSDSLQSTSNQPFQLVNAPFYLQPPHQSLYGVPIADSRDANVRKSYATPVACPSYGTARPPQIDQNFAHGSSAPIIQTQKNRRPRLEQSISAPHGQMSPFASLSANVKSPAPDTVYNQGYPRSRELRDPHSPLSSSSNILASSEPFQLSLVPHLQGKEARLEQSDGEAEGSQEAERYHEEEEELPVRSAASSNRDSTGAGSNEDPTSMILDFDISKFAQQTPARSTGLRAMMVRPEHGSPMNGMGAVYDESGLKTDGGQSIYPMNLFDSPMVSREADSSLHCGEFGPMSVGRSKSASSKHHQSTISSSGGSIDHWPSLETPSDLSYHGRREHFGFGAGHVSISSPGMSGHGLFDSPQHSSFGKSLGLAPPGTIGVDECIVGGGFLESAWDLNQS